jgi:hypothetical protein
MTANYSKAEPYSLASVVTRRLETHVILPVLKSLNQLHSRKSPLANMSVLLTLDHVLKTAVALVGRHFHVRRAPWGVILPITQDEAYGKDPVHGEVVRSEINRVDLSLMRFINISSSLCGLVFLMEPNCSNSRLA